MPTINENDKRKALTLFGGEKGWCADDWEASDDRVRGGKSQSYFHCTDDEAHFYGNLDIQTLGGAGFASQKSTSSWDLSGYSGVRLDITKADNKRYTFILKDDVPTTRKDGREEATISWEFDFELAPDNDLGRVHLKHVLIPWKLLNPTYRGKPMKDAKPLDLAKINQISLMMRSFFGSQEGDFSLHIQSISAICETPPRKV